MKLTKLTIGCIGGYLLSSLLSVTLSFVLPLSNKAESVLLATMLSYTIWLLAILYAFSKVTTKNLFIQFSLLSANLYLINTCLIAAKG